VDCVAAQPQRLARPLTPIPWVYGEIVRKLSQVEKVRILVGAQAEEAQARRVLGKVGAAMDAVEFYTCPTNRVWTRDYGPIFVKNGRGEMAATGWRFNAWRSMTTGKRTRWFRPSSRNG